MDFGYELMVIGRLRRILFKKPSIRPIRDPKKTDEITSEAEKQDMFVERIRIENMELRF